MKIEMKTGSMTSDQLNIMLNTIPFDLTLVDENDLVIYYNQRKNQLFSRRLEILGDTVQNCHSEKSVPTVNRVLDSLKSGESDVQSHIVDLKDRKALIMYIALRDSSGNYAGCLEVATDLDEISDKNVTGY